MSKPFRLSALGLLSAALLAGCTGMVREHGIEDAMQAAHELPATDTPTAPPSEVSDALLPSIQLQLPGVDKPQDTAQRFDIRVREVNARDFFLSLVEDTPYSMVVDPQIDGRISLDLKDVTVAETMDVVRTVHGYDYQLTGQIIQVFPNTIHTRLFEVDYLAVTRKGSSLTTTRSTQVSGSSGTGDGATQANNEQHSSSISTESETDFWHGLQESLRAMVGQGEGRNVAVHPHTGMVMVRALPSEMRVVEQYLRQSQLTLKRQVILEARILEVTLNDRFQSGINWAALRTNSDGTRRILGGQLGGTNIFDTMTSASDLNSGLNQLGNTFGNMFGAAAISTSNFAAFIEMLKTQGDVQVLSSPRVSTVNNQKAVIKVGSDEYYVTGIDTDTSSLGGTGTTNVSVNLESFFSGVALDVTPQISQKGDIVLHIHPSVSDVTEQTKTITTTLGTLTLPLAASNIRESDTVIRASNGQIVVIGGLMQNTTQNQQASVPVMGDIPLFGHLFRSTRQVTRKSELVILLKPIVVDEYGEVWQNEVQRSADTFGRQDR